MPPNGPEEWRARIGHWENRKLRWYQAHCGSRPRVPLHLHLERVISEARPMLCVLLLFSLAGMVATGVCEAGSGAFSSLHKLVGKVRCCTRVHRSGRGRVWSTHATLLYSLCLALCLLLVVAGDVETNPGPISGNKLTSDDLGDVLEAVLDASAQWYNLGLRLKVRTGTLDRIRTQFPDPNDQLREMLKAWLSTSDNPTWKTLTDSLRSRSVGASQLASDLETKCCPVNEIEVGRNTAASDSRPETSVFPPSPGSQPTPVPPVISQQTNTQESTQKHLDQPTQPPPVTTPSHPFTSTCKEVQTSATQEDDGEGIPEPDKDPHQSRHSSITSPPSSDKPPFGCGCGKCTFFSFIERGCPTPIPSASSFPYLDLSGLTHEQQQELRGRLRFESLEIMIHFQELVSSTILSLKEQQIPITDLVSHIMTLGAFDPVYKEPQIPAFHHYFRDLKSADTVSKVFVVLADYFSFFNYHIIEHIIKSCGTKEDKDNLLRYNKEFDQYAQRRIFECHPCFGPESETDHTDVFVKVDSQYENFTVIEVERFRCHLSKILRVSSQGVLRVCRVEKGCFQLMFQVPSFVQQRIFPLSREQERALVEERVIRLTCGQYQFLAEEYEQPPSQSVTVKASTKPPSDPRESSHLCRDFAIAFPEVANILNTFVHVSELKIFLESYSHHLHPEQLYIDPKIYRDASTTEQVMKSLFPQFINYMHYYLLEDIVVRFHYGRAKEILQQYTEQKVRCMSKLKDLPGPITSEEIEQFHGTIKLKVEVKGDISDATVEVIDKVEDALEKATGVDRTVIVYVGHDLGSILTFLIPESIVHIFHELNAEDLTIIANSRVMKLEVDERVIDNIQQDTTVKVAADSSEHTKQTGLEYYLQQRATEMTSERYSHLLKMLGSVDPKMFNDDCSEEFLKRFAKDLHDLKNLAFYFSIHEWNIEELVCNYPDEDDQKYQALLCWKRAEGSTATYYNLLESLILHGKVEELEVLLQRLGEGPVVLHASRWLKQQYLAHNGWQQWREVPNLIQFDLRLGELATQASQQLKNMDYSNCYNDIEEEFPSSVTPVSMKALVNACTTSDHSWSSKSCILIKGAPGQGKSFLLSNLCQYWAKGYGMRSTTLMFWVDCSKFQKQKMTLNQLLSQLLSFETENISSWIIKKQGKGVVFLLDGYNQQQSGGVFSNLASRNFLPKSVVLITSTCTPSEISVKQLELLKLSDNQICKQVVKFFSSRPSKVEDFCLCLTSNPDLRLLASIPVYLYTLLFVCDKLFDIPSCELSVTWTELFTNMVLLLLQAKFPKLLQIETAPDSLCQLPSTVQSFLSKISTVAFENLSSESFHLTLPEAKSLCYESGFALLHTYSKPLYNCEKQSFQFSSPLLQQFLAALHVHSQPLTKQTELMVQKSGLNFLWRFYTGLVPESYDRFQILKNSHKETVKLLISFSCAYEADWACDMSVFRDNILSAADMHHIVMASYNLPPDLSFEQCFLGRAAAYQLTRQVHTLAQSGQYYFRMSFKDCIFSSEGLVSLAAAPFQMLSFGGLSTEDVCALAMGLKKCRWVKGLKCLDLSQSDLTSTGAIALAKALQQNKSLEELKVEWDKIEWERIGKDGATALADVFRVTKDFKILNLGDNGVGDEGATILADVLKVNRSLKTLSLDRNGMTSIGAIALATALQHNKSLEKLNLRDNGIGDEGTTALADTLRVNQNLKTLNLHQNDLTSTGVIALARTLQQNKSLEELNLELNETGIQGAAALANALRVNQSLKKLNLRDSGLTSTGAIALARALQQNKSLQELNLEGNRFQWTEIGDEGATALADLRVIKNFTTLNLKDNRLTSIGAIALARALQHNKSLEELNLGLNETGVSGASALADALKVNQNLKTLDLNNNEIGSEGATALADALKVNKSLKTLNLYHNNLSDSGAIALANALQQNKSLEKLNVYHNFLTSTGAIALARALQQNKSLKELNLEWDEIQWRDIGDDGAIALTDPRVFKNFKILNVYHNSLTSTGAIALAKVLQQNKSLEELNLEWDEIQWRDIGDDGAIALTDPRVFKNFTTLNLEGNAIGDSGASALANALRVNKSLKTLNVYHNSLTTAGAIALARALQHNKSLEELNLEWDEIQWRYIGDDGAIALTDPRVFKNFKTLNLRHNWLTDTGARVLATALQHNKSLEELNLEWNEIRDSGASTLADALRVNQSLKTLNLEENAIGDSGAIALANALRVNQSLKTLK